MSTAIDDTRRQAEHGSPGKLKTALGAAAGTCVENYDFVAYGTASALYFGDVFFPESDPVTGTLLSFATLGVGFLDAPDRRQRRWISRGSVRPQARPRRCAADHGHRHGPDRLPAHLCTGRCPCTCSARGIRVIQGLAFGAEWGGAVLMAFEHAPWRQRGRFAAIPQAGNPLGIALANIAFLAAAPLDSDWSWRIPFLASSILIGVGLFVRLRLSESPEFEMAKAAGKVVRNPFLTVLREDWRNILRDHRVTCRRVLRLLPDRHLPAVLHHQARPGGSHHCAHRRRDRQRHRRRHDPVCRPTHRPRRPPTGVPRSAVCWPSHSASRCT